MSQRIQFFFLFSPISPSVFGNSPLKSTLKLPQNDSLPKKIIECTPYNIYKSLILNTLLHRKKIEKKLLKIRLLKKMIVFLHSKF